MKTFRFHTGPSIACDTAQRLMVRLRSYPGTEHVYVQAPSREAALSAVKELCGWEPKDLSGWPRFPGDA